MHTWKHGSLSSAVLLLVLCIGRQTCRPVVQLYFRFGKIYDKYFLNQSSDFFVYTDFNGASFRPTPFKPDSR
jgi:hypothetical protein